MTKSKLNNETIKGNQPKFNKQNLNIKYNSTYSPSIRYDDRGTKCYSV